jgi:hypothetical protein
MVDPSLKKIKQVLPISSGKFGINEEKNGMIA